MFVVIGRKELAVLFSCLGIFIFTALTLPGILDKTLASTGHFAEATEPKEEYIKWMQFDVPEEVLHQALAYDLEYYNSETPVSWIELIAYGSAKNWGKFEPNKKSKAIDQLMTKLTQGEHINDHTKDLKLYPFYLETYSAVLNGMVGEYEIIEEDPGDPDRRITTKKYGLKAFFPLAAGYGYSHFDDFGVSRSYGYKRRHLGHDLMGSVGTPVIAVEDGYVEALGWNQYGGWRIGIRSVDKKRYYYYAHLRKGHPFHLSLNEGSFVRAGDVIGYLGMTGYSRKENVNNIKTPHLHFGLQIIFNESQKDGSNQIWIDMYELVNFLSKNKMKVRQDSETKDFNRTGEINNIVTD